MGANWDSYGDEDDGEEEDRLQFAKDDSWKAEDESQVGSKCLPPANGSSMNTLPAKRQSVKRTALKKAGSTRQKKLLSSWKSLTPASKSGEAEVEDGDDFFQG